jgi:hypothetical protein
VPPPNVELMALESDISIMSSLSASLSELLVSFPDDASAVHAPSGWIVTESTDLGVFARIS